MSELLVVICGAAILTGIGVPVMGTLLDNYGAIMAAQEITTNLQYARMKAVSSNESFRVSISPSGNSYSLETSAGALHSGPYTLPQGITWNNIDSGGAVTFPGNHVIFLPTGNLPSAGNGSTGRIKIINRSGVRVDIVVSPGGMIRATPTYKTAGGAAF